MDTENSKRTLKDRLLNPTESPSGFFENFVQNSNSLGWQVGLIVGVTIKRGS